MSVSARVMYIVMPKQSSRRGDIPGYAQLVLTVSHNTAPASAVDAGDVTTNVDVNMNTNGDAQAVISNATKAQLVASARLALQAALETLVDKGKALNVSVAVELSHSQKTYRNTNPINRRDRHIGTIMKSEDYKRFLEDRKRTEEELQAKKKPAPGGENSDSNGETEKVAALVLHLNARREAELQAKQKKKAAKTKNKQNQNQSPTKVMTRDRDRLKASSLLEAKKKAKEEGGASSSKQAGAKSDSKKKRRNKKHSSKAKSNANGKANANVNPTAAVAILSVK